LRNHDLERCNARWTTHVRAKQFFGLGPRERNDIVILLLGIPRLVMLGALTTSRMRAAALVAVFVVPLLRRLVRRFDRHRSVPQSPVQSASFRTAYGIA
jgi:hypothetical protein